jgi:signal transduction histidine kinase
LTVLGNARLLQTALANLLRNALEALPAPGAPLAVTARASPPDRAILTIRNAGEVPPALRARFFEKYATGGKPGGTGLGTYSARLMVRAENGDIAVDCGEPGFTTLTITLPLADAGAPGRNAAEAAEAAESAGLCEPTTPSNAC